MRRKKLLLIFAALGIVILCLLIFIAIKAGKARNKENEYKEVDIISNKWNDIFAEYVFCTVTGKVSFSTGSETGSGYFETDASLEEMISANIEDYIGNGEIHWDGSSPRKEIKKEPAEAALFFSDDNYYYIFWEKETDVYIMGNLCARWDGGSLHAADIRFPFPEPILFFENISKYWDIQYIFECHDFEDMKEFYSRISEEYYSVDEENQIIKVKAYGNTYSLSWEGGYRYEIIIDCKNRTITGPTRDGGTITLQ